MAYSRFTSRRGRPTAPTTPRDTDLGTPELIMKRACGQTSEAVDVCLEKGLIDRQQHRAALHMRWLYTLRFGAPGISAADVMRLHRHESQSIADVSLWRQQREQEYEQAAQLLKQHKRYEAVVNLCVYDIRPRYLDTRQWDRAYRCAALRHQMHHEISQLQGGLDLLVSLWRKPDNRKLH